MKLNNVWNVIPKVLTYVRTHPKELLVPKIWFSLFFEYQKSKMEFLTIWKNWKMSRMSFWKFSPMCKNLTFFANTAACCLHAVPNFFFGTEHVDTWILIPLFWRTQWSAKESFDSTAHFIKAKVITGFQSRDRNPVVPWTAFPLQ